MCRSRSPFAPILLLLALSLGGCAVGNVHRYDDVAPRLSPSGALALALAVHDQRPYVLSGEKSPTYVGTQRGGFGNPFNVTTASGRPLADDMGDALASALKAKGYGVTVVRTSPPDTDDAVKSKLGAAAADRRVLLTLRHWKSDSYANTALNYDLTLRAWDAAGGLLAEKSLAGRNDLGGSFWNPPAHAREAAPAAFRQKMEELFASPELEKALRQ